MSKLLKIETSTSEPLLHKYFFNKRNLLMSKLDELGPVKILKLSDGIVYVFDGAYSLAGKNNKVFQVIITDLEKHGLTIFNTNQIKAKNSKIISELGFYFQTLYGIIIDPDYNDNVVLETIPTHTVGDIREQIIIEHNKE